MGKGENIGVGIREVEVRLGFGYFLGFTERDLLVRFVLEGFSGMLKLVYIGLRKLIVSIIF